MGTPSEFSSDCSFDSCPYPPGAYGELDSPSCLRTHLSLHSHCEILRKNKKGNKLRRIITWAFWEIHN